MVTTTPSIYRSRNKSVICKVNKKRGYSRVREERGGRKEKEVRRGRRAAPHLIVGYEHKQFLEIDSKIHFGCKELSNFTRKEQQGFDFQEKKTFLC